MYLVDTVGDDLLVLMNELTKLAAFAGKEGITREIIDSVAVKSVEASIFDLSAAIIENNADKAFSILSVLKQERVSPQIIIGTLASITLIYTGRRSRSTTGESMKLSLLMITAISHSGLKKPSEPYAYGNEV